MDCHEIENKMKWEHAVVIPQKLWDRKKHGDAIGERLSVIQHWDRKKDEMRTCSCHPAEKLPNLNKASFSSKHGLTQLGAPPIVLSHVWMRKRPYSNWRAVACLPPSPCPSPNFSDRWFNDMKAFQLYKRPYSNFGKHGEHGEHVYWCVLMFLWMDVYWCFFTAQA